MPYALVGAGNFNYEDILIKEDVFEDADGNIKIRLVELCEGAFEKVFNCKGYVYSVEYDVFKEWAEYDTGVEMRYKGVCGEIRIYHDVEVLDKFVINNVWEEMQIVNKVKGCYELYRYDDPYWGKDGIGWLEVGGGREGYMKRRMERVEKIRNEEISYNYYNGCRLVKLIDNWETVKI